MPQNLNELYPQVNDDNICIVCRIATRTHALVPCGHTWHIHAHTHTYMGHTCGVLCVDCLAQLEAQRCPLCNTEFNMSIRIW